MEENGEKRVETPGTEAAVLKKGEHDQNPEKPDDTARAERAETDQTDDQRLKALEARAEAYYDEMYDSSHPIGPYSDTKEAFYDAIALARQLGRQEDVERLEKRLNHVKETFRRYFT